MKSLALTEFGTRFTARTGILELMEDLAPPPTEQMPMVTQSVSERNAEPDDSRRPPGADVQGTGAATVEAVRPGGVGAGRRFMLGGGNPGLVPEVCELWRSRMSEMLEDRAGFDRMIGAYEAPEGNADFVESLAALLRNSYGLPVTSRNITVTNGSQTAFFFLLNMFAGRMPDGSLRKILFPISPEYIGYADQSLASDCYVSVRALIEETGPRSFKYRIDFENLKVTDDIGAICVSRPTNPSGNVLTDDEVRRLSGLAAEHDIPLIVDNAYGLPFPGIIFGEAAPVWDEHVILCMSLSKLGLPSTRNGIVIASEEVVKAVTAMNSICCLATGGIGQRLVQPLIRSGEILSLSREVIRPFYLEKSRQAVEWIHAAFDRTCDYAIHRSEGAIFLWVWFKDLPISTSELYRRLKARNVIVLPGRHFFFGLEKEWPHAEQCIRINYAQEPDVVRQGIELIGEVLRGIS